MAPLFYIRLPNGDEFKCTSMASFTRGMFKLGYRIDDVAVVDSGWLKSRHLDITGEDAILLLPPRFYVEALPEYKFP